MFFKHILGMHWGLPKIIRRFTEIVSHICRQPLPILMPLIKLSFSYIDAFDKIKTDDPKLQIHEVVEIKTWQVIDFRYHWTYCEHVYGILAPRKQENQFFQEKVQIEVFQLKIEFFPWKTWFSFLLESRTRLKTLYHGTHWVWLELFCTAFRKRSVNFQHVGKLLSCHISKSIWSWMEDVELKWFWFCTRKWKVMNQVSIRTGASFCDHSKKDNFQSTCFKEPWTCSEFSTSLLQFS